MKATYTTSDGQTFDNKAEARAHEKSLNPAGSRARSTDALPQDMVAAAFADLSGPVAKQIMTLASQLRVKRVAAGMTRKKAA